jgi:hypothetical protein
MVTLRMCCAAVVVTAVACAHIGQPKSPELNGTYRFSDMVPGLGNVSGTFDVNADGRVTRFNGGCSQSIVPMPDGLSAECRIQRLRLAAHDDSTVRTVAVRVRVSEVTPSPSDPTRTWIRHRTYNAVLAASR